MKTTTLECANCHALHRVEVEQEGPQGFPVPLDTVPCQGAAPDSCTARLCESCRIQCDGCELYACADHIVKFSGESLCHNCIAVIVADGAEELLMTSQEAATTITVLAMAGCTVDEIWAAMTARLVA